MKDIIQNTGWILLAIAIALAILSLAFYAVMKVFVCPFYSFKTITEIPSICIPTGGK